MADVSSTQRRKRVTGVCEQRCSSLNDSMAETCLYDCYQATDTEFQQQVGLPLSCHSKSRRIISSVSHQVSDSMEDATETSEEVVEVDTELSETAVQEDVPDDVVKTTVAMATDSFFVSTVTMAGVSGRCCKNSEPILARDLNAAGGFLSSGHEIVIDQPLRHLVHFICTALHFLFHGFSSSL